MKEAGHPGVGLGLGLGHPGVADLLFRHTLYRDITV